MPPSFHLQAIIVQRMIEYWLTHAEEIDERKPCLRLLLIAVAARYGGANPALAQYLMTLDCNIKGKDFVKQCQ